LLSPTDHKLILIDFQSQMASATKSMMVRVVLRRPGGRLVVKLSPRNSVTSIAMGPVPPQPFALLDDIGHQSCIDGRSQKDDSEVSGQSRVGMSATSRIVGMRTSRGTPGPTAQSSLSSEQSSTSDEPSSESLGDLVIEEAESLNRLYKIISHAGCDILFYDGKEELVCCWSEMTVGNVKNRCCTDDDALETRLDKETAATIFNHDGDVIGYVEALSQNRNLTDGELAMICAAVNSTARMIEERSFRKRYRDKWIIALAPVEGTGCGPLLAIDRRQHVVDADRHAREVFSDIDLDRAVSLWALFDNVPALFRPANTGDVRTALCPRGKKETWTALVTPPQSAAATWHSSNLHCRPRADAMVYLPGLVAMAPLPRGLAPRVLKRVRDYVDAHLGEEVNLSSLAEIAGLSQGHFTRAFKQSLGMTPHGYVMQRRLERAKRMIAETVLPLARIALECGFSDQSHLSRRFLQYVGMTPRSFRWSAR
jgi:AraC-like DNA-binding protein